MDHRGILMSKIEIDNFNKTNKSIRVKFSNQNYENLK